MKEGSYEVHFGPRTAGKVQVTRQGLYYRFVCRCRLTGEVVCRLWATFPDKRCSLGVVVPMEEGFGLDTRLPAKTFPEDTPVFTLIPKHEINKERFVPLAPEEPFAYIERLKDGYLAHRENQLGVILPGKADKTPEEPGPAV